MIEIKYGGGNSFEITCGKENLIINPNRKIFNLNNISVKGQTEIATEEQYKIGDQAKLIINTPGEYEVGSFSIRGIAAQKYSDYELKNQAIIYTIETNDAKVAVLGDIKPNLTDDELESIGLVDILLLPVGGGGYTLYAKEAAKIVRQIEPKIIIPTTYKSDIKYPVELENLENIEKELGLTIDQEKTLKLKSTKDLADNMKIIKLEVSI